MAKFLEFLSMVKGMEELAGLISFLAKVGSCIIFIIIGSIVIKFTGKLIEKAIKSNSKISERKANTLATVCKSVARYFIYFIVLCQILSVFKINISSILTIAGVGSVAIGFGAQSLVQDIISGLFILMEDQFGVGDVVSIESHSGTVEAIGIRTTRIRSADGNLYIIPNGQVKIVTNMSKGFNRAVVDIGIAYEENIDRTIKVMQDEMQQVFDNQSIEGLMSVPKVLGVVELADSSVNIRISADSHVGENWQIEREIRRVIKNRLDKENIVIPYPQRVVHYIDERKEEKV